MINLTKRSVWLMYYCFHPPGEFIIPISPIAFLIDTTPWCIFTSRSFVEFGFTQIKHCLGITMAIFQLFSSRQPRKRDGPWSWLVCACATMTWVASLGFLFSFGIFLPVFMNYFNESRETTG